MVRSLTAKYTEGAAVATRYMPQQLFGSSDLSTDYSFEPANAKQLPEVSGLNLLTHACYYPKDARPP